MWLRDHLAKCFGNQRHRLSDHKWLQLRLYMCTPQQCCRLSVGCATSRSQPDTHLSLRQRTLRSVPSCAGTSYRQHALCILPGFRSARHFDTQLDRPQVRMLLVLHRHQLGCTGTSTHRLHSCMLALAHSRRHLGTRMGLESDYTPLQFHACRRSPCWVRKLRQRRRTRACACTAGFRPVPQYHGRCTSQDLCQGPQTGTQQGHPHPGKSAECRQD